jgi:hypothetical protein
MDILPPVARRPVGSRWDRYFQLGDKRINTSEAPQGLMAQEDLYREPQRTGYQDGGTPTLDERGDLSDPIWSSSEPVDPAYKPWFSAADPGGPFSTPSVMADQRQAFEDVGAQRLATRLQAGDFGAPGTVGKYKTADAIPDDTVPLPRPRPDEAPPRGAGMATEPPAAAIQTPAGPALQLANAATAGLEPSTWGYNFLTSPWGALTAAGLGAAAGTSYNALTNIAAGGLEGLKAVGAGAKLDMDVRKLNQLAQQHAETLASQQKIHSLGWQTNPDGTMSPVPGGPHDPAYLTQQYQAKMGAPLSNEALEIGAHQLANGDLSALHNVGKGAQGDAMIRALRNRAAQILIARGGDPAQVAQYLSGRIQEFKARQIGLSAEARTQGVREANLNLILKAADAAIPAAIEASANVTRYGGPFVPLNKIIQNGQLMTSDPALREFGMANLQLAEHWARAMNPTGVMRESDRDMALSYLSTATSHETYVRMVQQLQKQITRERDAIHAGRQHPGEQTPIAPGGAAPSETPTVGERKQFRQGWGVWNGRTWVPEGTQ